jgi:hypothetical protein
MLVHEAHPKYKLAIIGVIHCRKDTQQKPGAKTI